MLHVSNKMWKNLTVPGVKKRVTIGELDSDTMYNLTIYSENKYGVGQRKSNVLQVETTKSMSRLLFKMSRKSCEKWSYSYVKDSI
jgi:hypothetical protein